MELWLEYAGRWHVALVHFPIGLLITAAIVEFFATLWRRQKPSISAVVMVTCGVVAVMIVAPLGWIRADDVRHPGMEKIVELHRWTGLAILLPGTFAAIIGWSAIHRPSPGIKWLFRGLVLATAILVIVTAHWGGELIYGDDYFDLPTAEAVSDIN